MFRRFLSVIVMTGFVVGQLAAVPHSHPGVEHPFDHDARPHIHVAWFTGVGECHDHEHAHHHESGGHHSHPTAPDSEPEDRDHDSDAVYLTNDIAVSLPNTSVASIENQAVPTAATIGSVPLATTTADCLAGPLFACECKPGCPLYLVLRALRI